MSSSRATVAPVRVAIVDCGTNTIRLLIADGDPAGGLTELDRRMEIVRLGQGVDATGEFHPDALQRTFAATERYAQVIEDFEVPPGHVRFVATSASRDVANRDLFFAGITGRLGVTPEVISGDEEARLSFAGALSGAADPTPPVLVADIGGGSTELIIGDHRGVDHAVSLDIGSVRITERFFADDPPTAADLIRATEYVDRMLDDQQLERVRTWIGVAGTLTTLAAVDLELTEYDRDQVHGHRIAVTDLAAIADRLAALPADRIREIPGVHPKRADVITAGALIATRIARRLPVDSLVVSESDILDGAALQTVSRISSGVEK